MMRRLVLLLGLLAVAAAQAHSASDAYLTVDAQAASGTLRLQWDIALRDLDFVMNLDDDGKGAITWGEVRRHQSAITAYALSHLKVLADGQSCGLSLAKAWISNHADGAYAALFVTAQCPAAPRRLTLDYRVFFDIDPSHRAILVARTGSDTSTALLSPQNARIDLDLARAK